MAANDVDSIDLPAQVAESRTRFRSKVKERWYHGYFHVAITVAVPLLVISGAVSQLGYDKAGNPVPLNWWDWSVIPITLLVANVVEYIGHRGPMHHRMKGRFLERIFEVHSGDHHHFFTETAMTCRSPKDFKIVLFPPILLVAFLGLVAIPAAAVMYWLTTRNGALMVLACSMFYFLAYEVLHFSYHIDENSFIGRLWLVRVLREHHRVHHNLKLMANYNFNVTWPIADLLFGTVYRKGKYAATQGGSDDGQNA